MIKTELNGFLLVLLSLPLFQLFQIVVLPLLPLFQIILLSLQPHNHLPQLAGFLLRGVAVHAVELEGLDPDAERDLFLLLQLLLGLGHLPARVLHVAHAPSVGLLGTSLLVPGGLLLLLSLHHGLPLLLGLLQPLPLLLGLLRFLLGLLFLQPLQLFLLLGALLPPLVDVLPQLLVQLSLLRLLARFQEVSIAFFGGIGYFLVLVELLVRHDGGGGVVGGAELF